MSARDDIIRVAKSYTDAMISGKQFYGTTTCTADDNSCPIDGTVTNNNNRCYSGYYMTPSDENVMECTTCHRQLSL